MVGSLVVVVSNFKSLQNPLLMYEVEVRHRPSIPDNVKHWQGFEDDEQIKWFIEVVGELTSSTIDLEEKKEAYQEPTSWENTVDGQKNLHLEGNAIPRGLVPLEKLYNQNDVASKEMALEMDQEVEDFNIGSEDEPQMFSLSK